MGFSICATAQLKNPFPDSTGAWIISWSSIDYPNVFTGAFRYYVNGDTICNNTSYKKLYEGVNDLFDSTVTSNNLKGLFRVDSNKVFYKNINQAFESFGFTDTNEVLLYDFSLMVGDSILNLNDGSTQNYVKVISIDSIELNGEYLKQWHFDEYFVYQLTWTEGIGSNIGFFNYFLFFEYGQLLACFNENGQDYHVGIADKPHNISIYNTTGKLIQSFQTTEKSFQIDLIDFKSGVYILKITNDLYQSVHRLLLIN